MICLDCVLLYVSRAVEKSMVRCFNLRLKRAVLIDFEEADERWRATADQLYIPSLVKDLFARSLLLLITLMSL